MMTLSELFLNWDLLVAAFARQHLTLTLQAATAIFLEVEPQWEHETPAPQPPPSTPAPVPVPVPDPPAPIEVTPYSHDQIVGFYETYLGRPPENDDVVREWMHDPNAPVNIRHTQEGQRYAEAHRPAVAFDHAWPGLVESALHDLLASGLAGPDGLNGQAVVDQMNAKGGLYTRGSFNPHHNGPSGAPTYGYPWFYVSYVPVNGVLTYQIVEFGPAPAGN